MVQISYKERRLMSLKPQWIQTFYNTFVLVLRSILLSRPSCSRTVNNHKDYNQFTWQDGLLFWKKQLYIPDESSWLQVLRYYHDSLMDEHYGIYKTLELISYSKTIRLSFLSTCVVLKLHIVSLQINIVLSPTNKTIVLN